MKPLEQNQHHSQQKITLYLDFTCLWSYIGWRNFTKALALRGGQKPAIELIYRSHELNSALARDEVILFQEYMLHRFGDNAAIRDWQDIIFQAGIDTGLMIDFSRLEFIFNTRLLHHMMKALQYQHFITRDNYQQLHEFIEKIFHTIIIEGRLLNSKQAILEYTGFDYDALLKTRTHSQWDDDVESDITHARSAGITGIPCYCFGKDYSLFGAQGVKGYSAMLDLFWETGKETNALLSKNGNHGNAHSHYIENFTQLG